MKKLKKLIRLCGLVVFIILAVAGIGIFGVAPTLTKDRKLFVDEQSKTEITDRRKNDNQLPDE
ncbi:hypothetical protein AAFN85_23240 [Mucilaginibacter sp. CAU 1740]|uniref:hypothetical protein n=1 Tax=Mucilaginibacter sp. CAU 1740 TaxID=3140365 RepID=UPI00325A98F1